MSTRAFISNVEVRASGIHGLGVFSICDMPAGTEIGEYAGRRLSPRQVARMQWNNAKTYLFGLSDGSYIDATATTGNHTRYLNHSCAPNCEALEVEDGSRLKVVVQTLKSVKAGDELFIDYALSLDPADSPEDYPCRCKARSCRGTIALVT